MDIQGAQWITLPGGRADTVPLFRRRFPCEKPVRKAELEITAAGVYEAELNGERVGRFILAPGWTEYDRRIQVQTYDVTDMLRERNTLEAVVGPGWFRRRLPDWTAAGGVREEMPAALIAPHPDSRVESLSAKIDTVHGAVSSSWRHTDGRVRYEISVCVPAEIRIDGRVTRVGPGTYIF